jgi:hypothetical protein
MKFEWLSCGLAGPLPRKGRPQARFRRFGATAGLAGLLAFLGAASACVVPVAEEPPNPTRTVASKSSPKESPVKPARKVIPVPPTPSVFALKPEWQGPCAKAATVDVNLGNSPESFVKAAYCQITGHQPPADVVEQWAGRLKQDPHVRRIDVVRSLAADQKAKIKLAYSDPWESQPELLDVPVRQTDRDIGAVLMFFFGCPGETNCGMEWANTHAAGMKAPSPVLGMGPGESGLYSPDNPGFWRRELLDARYAGLQFLMLNTYGPDIEDGKLAPLTKALDSIDKPIKIALFDDTWTWGEPYFSDFWKQKPDLNDTEKAAALIYEHKWKPFFQQVDKKYWYRFAGRPFIYFYNAGTLSPASKAAALIANLKARFKADFGEEPFVDVDIAYFDDPKMPQVADAKFKWMTHSMPARKSRSTLNGHIIDHAMVKWDSVGRDHPGEIAGAHERLIKDATVLQQVLDSSSDAELLVIATWNDLGEGTGINRNYDYYAGGRWLEPDYFMRIVRDSQRGASK